MENQEPARKTIQMFQDVNRKIETILQGTISIELVKQDISYIKKKVDDIESSMRKDYITRMEFDLEMTPLKKIVYGAVAFILVGFLAVLGALVFKR